MALFTQEAMANMQAQGMMWFETSCPTKPFYGLPLPPSPPIITSAWYWMPTAIFPGIAYSFFNRTGTYRAKCLSYRREHVSIPRLGIWSRICRAVRAFRSKSPTGESSAGESSAGESPADEKARTNQQNSQLYRLPVELLELVGEQLPPVSRLCMRRVCIRFRVCLERLGPELQDDVLLRTEVFQFNLLLKLDARHHLQDQYNRRCDSANSKSLLYQRGCSGCLKIHGDSHAFSTRALSEAPTNSPKTRVCAGLEGSIEVCEHISFSAECLLRGLHDFGQLEMYCQMHRLVRGVYGDRCTTLETDASYGPRISYYDGTRITINRRFYLFSVPVGKEHTHQEFFDALQVIDGAICPHLRTGSPHILNETELKAECSNGGQDNPDDAGYYNLVRRPCSIMLEFGPRDRETCIIWSKCPNTECDTWFGLRRIFVPMGASHPDVHHILFEVKRNFVGDPTHPSWRAQIGSMGHAGLEGAPKTGRCVSRYGSCKGPVCAARHHGLVITPSDMEGTMYHSTTKVQNF